jgi:hypothetical protein
MGAVRNNNTEVERYLKKSRACSKNTPSSFAWTFSTKAPTNQEDRGDQTADLLIKRLAAEA